MTCSVLMTQIVSERKVFGWFQTKNCLNQSDDVTNAFDDAICQEV